MKTPNVGDIVSVIRYAGIPTRATVAKSFKRRFIVIAELVPGRSRLDVQLSFERAEEGRTWTRGWDTEDAIAWRAQIALAACR